jgi:hypothetical protein
VPHLLPLLLPPFLARLSNPYSMLTGPHLPQVNMYSKYLDFPDAPVVAPETPYQPAGMYQMNGPRLREFLQEMNRECFAKYEYVKFRSRRRFTLPYLHFPSDFSFLLLSTSQLLHHRRAPQYSRPRQDPLLHFRRCRSAFDHHPLRPNGP